MDSVTVSDSTHDCVKRKGSKKIENKDTIQYNNNNNKQLPCQQH